MEEKMALSRAIFVIILFYDNVQFSTEFQTIVVRFSHFYEFVFFLLHFYYGRETKEFFDCPWDKLKRW